MNEEIEPEHRVVDAFHHCNLMSTIQLMQVLFVVKLCLHTTLLGHIYSSAALVNDISVVQ